MKREIRRLPDGELEVMQALWNCPQPALRTELEARLEHSVAPTTLLTILSRLSEKGFVNVEKQGRTACYTALIKKEDYLSSQSSRFIRNLCGGNMKTFASALCDSGLTKQELRELRELLERDEL